jgi:Methyltransferase domain
MSATTMNDFISPASFGMPHRLVQSAWLEHGPFAFWLIEQLRPRLIAELGTERGYSLAAFCQALKEGGQTGRAIGIDTWKGDEHTGPYNEQVFQDVTAYFGTNHAGRATLKRMYFSEALKDVADGSVDLLHVDGRHYYDDVKEDHTTWIGKLSDRAVVLFHDTQVRDRGFAVWKYFAELAATHPTFEFHHGNGLGILAHGKNVPEAITRLTAPGLDAKTAGDIRAAYARLGGALSVAYERDSYQRRYEKLRYPLRHLANKIGGG